MSKKRSIVAVVGAVISILAGVLGGLFVAVYLCLYGGIVQIIHGVSVSPLGASDIAIGAVRVLATGFCGWLTFVVCLFFAHLFANTGD